MGIFYSDNDGATGLIRTVPFDDNDKPQPIVPKTINEFIWKVLCG